MQDVDDASIASSRFELRSGLSDRTDVTAANLLVRDAPSNKKGVDHFGCEPGTIRQRATVRGCPVQPLTGHLHSQL